jgi:N,N'-diacetyllegionaminate synthase
MKSISTNSDVYIIAEIGMNHDGSFGNALKLIESAAKSGVDAVKFQMHISDKEMLEDALSPPYFHEEGRFAYFGRTAFTDEQWNILSEKSHDSGVDFVISPFSEEAVGRCQKLKVDYLKIASGEVNNIFLLNAVHDSGVPSILSSGMSSYDELDQAVNILARTERLKAILQCSSVYPCSAENVGLNVIGILMNTYGDLAIGLSDHTTTDYASHAAVTLGAKVIEKHFTLTKYAYGPDAKFSYEPDEMRRLSEGIRLIERMLDSDVNKDNVGQYSEMRKVFCKRIVAKEKIDKGEAILYTMLTSKKSRYGVMPSELPLILNRVTKREIQIDEIITPDDVE